MNKMTMTFGLFPCLHKECEIWFNQVTLQLAVNHLKVPNLIFNVILSPTATKYKSQTKSNSNLIVQKWNYKSDWSLLSGDNSFS